MPEFVPGSIHRATATFSNPKSAGFDYEASLCMGAWVEMATAPFHLDAGQSKAVQFQVTMPTIEGAYPVGFKVTSGGVLIGTFISAEDVVIAPALLETMITAVSWTVVDFPFLWYGDWPWAIAKFAKAQVEIQSSTEFVAKIGISCPDVIAPINLVNEDQRQKILDWYDELIAAQTTDIGRQIYQTQKNAFLTFPEVDGFTIIIGGYPATHPQYWFDFTQYLIQSTSTLYFNGSWLIVPQGISTINVGFFKRHNAVLGLNPVLIELYRDEVLLSSLESEIVPP